MCSEVIGRHTYCVAGHATPQRRSTNAKKHDDSFRRDGNRRDRSRGSSHTAPIAYDYRHILSNRGQSLPCVEGFMRREVQSNSN